MATLNTQFPAASRRIRRIVAVGALVAGMLAALFASPSAQAGQGDANRSAQTGKPIPGHYIVQVERGTDPKGLAEQHRANPKFVYRDAINGFAAELNDRQVEVLRHNQHVTAIEQDSEGSGDTTQSLRDWPGAWGIDRIDQRNRPLSTTYVYNHTAPGVHAYVLDSGIELGHAEFGGRATSVWDGVDGTGSPCTRHGTHVAGILGGRTFGVAKQVRLHSVRVIDCANTYTNSRLIAGVDWVRRNAAKPAVANMSLGGGRSDAVNTAVANLSDSGVFVSVTAGNANSDACTRSPASAPRVFTVASSDRNDARAATSGYGPCVEGYAPGVDILSARLGGGSVALSGTSMASPHVAGVVALGKEFYGDSLGNDAISSADWIQWVINTSTRGVISSNSTPTATPNRLLHTYGL